MRDASEHPHELPDQLVAWATPNSLSRQDMALATHLTLEEVDRIIRETVERDRTTTAHALQAQAARHMPHGERTGR
jgi:tyrosyl-tRNA synthetase